jgi:hypothetical protein
MVTERIVRIPQADLTRLRITCLICKKVAEVGIQEASATIRGGICPFCGEEVWGPHGQGTDPFAQLNSSWRAFGETEG